MRITLFAIIILSFSPALTQDLNSYEFIKTVNNADIKTIGFSRVATPGKISVFIIGTHWCPPCVALKKQLDTDLISGKLDSRYVDVYDYTLSSSPRQSQREFRRTPSVMHTTYIDQLTEIFPTTYITTQTTNCYTIVKGAKYGEIVGHIEDLLKVQEYFNESSFNFATSENLVESTVGTLNPADYDPALTISTEQPSDFSNSLVYSVDYIGLLTDRDYFNSLRYVNTVEFIMKLDDSMRAPRVYPDIQCEEILDNHLNFDAFVPSAIETKTSSTWINLNGASFHFIIRPGSGLDILSNLQMNFIGYRIQDNYIVLKIQVSSNS